MKLHIREIQARPVVVPIRRQLQTSTGAVTQAPLLLIDLHTEDGIIGRSYLFGVSAYTIKPLRDLVLALSDFIKGTEASPHAVERKLRQRTTLLGPYYLLGMALSGIDMACWDVVALAADLPLVTVLGGTRRPIPAYNSNGLGFMSLDLIPAAAAQLVEEGFGAIKIRLGREKVEDDLAAVRAVKKRVRPDVLLMADFNQALSTHEAIRRCRLLDEEGLYWIEEPVRADDFSGCARVSSELKTPVQIGENFSGTHQMKNALDMHASDFVMPDLQRIGGITGWLRAAALAEAAGVEMSSHLFPEISASVLAVTPTSHWLEYVDWANPILQDPLLIRNGHAVTPERPGNGLVWDEAAIAKLPAM